MHSSLRRSLTTLLVAVVCAFVLVSQAGAYTVLMMDLDELCGRADKIFRGTVLDMTLGTVQVGGAELPTVTYKIEASDVLKGEIAETKGALLIEVTMLGRIKPGANDTPGLRHVSALPELPNLNVGQEYLLLTTAPSTVGLSTTVGLGQGSFRIFSDDKLEMAVNLLDNQGLFDGPVAYTALADEIRNAVGQ